MTAEQRPKIKDQEKEEMLPQRTPASKSLNSGGIVSFSFVGEKTDINRPQENSFTVFI